MSDTDLYLQGYEDAFGNKRFESSKNVLDIASHYKVNPERWRLFKNGVRQLLLYNDPPEYEHNGYEHLLKPTAGDTIALQTAERPRYVVQYELMASWALSLNQKLQGNDRIRWGLWDGNDGWFFEQLSSHTKAQCDLYVAEGGEEIRLQKDVYLGIDTTKQSRPALQTSWYRVGPQKFLNSFTEKGLMKNHVVGNTSIDNRGGPEVGNLPLRYEVRADASTSNLVLRAGSVALANLGTTTSYFRTKIGRADLNIGLTGTWVPLAVLRHDPSKNGIVNIQIRDMLITSFSGTGDARLLLQAHYPSNVLDGTSSELTDSDFSAPELMTAKNQALQISENVNEAADSDGQTQVSAAKPGGWQIGYASLDESGEGSKSRTEKNTIGSKRPLYSDEYGVLWGYATATGDISLEFATEQDY